MYPQNKSNAKRGYAEREQKRKLARHQAASEWQQEIFPEEEKMNTFWRSIVIVGLVCLTVLCLAACIISGYAGNIFSRPATVIQAAPVIEATIAPTEPIIVVTEAPVVEAVFSCPNTTEEAKNLFGIDVQRIATEACAWVWRGKPLSTSVTCPVGYICTFDVLNDVTVVHYGVGQSAQVYAGTWRLVSAYPAGDKVHNICALYQAEKQFGQQEVPSFEVRYQAVPNLGPQSCPEQ